MAGQSPEELQEATHVQDLKYLIDQFRTQNDRTVAIVLCAYLEGYLERGIKLNLKGANASLRDRLFSSTGILSPISAKIDIATALGLMQADLRDDYITLVRIRNRFAHNFAIDSFNHPEVSMLISQLRTQKERYDQMDPYPTNRWRFTDTGMVLSVGLHNYWNAAVHDYRKGKRSWIPK